MKTINKRIKELENLAIKRMRNEDSSFLNAWLSPEEAEEYDNLAQGMQL